MTFCLDTTILKPEKKDSINNAIILLHGYGGDGKDISMLALNWKRFLPNTIFLCPNGPEVCPINPVGYQWFDLTKDDPKYILEESKKSEKKLLDFIDEVKNKYNLRNSKICLSGFSQGSMMSINLGLISIEDYNCVVGFSGKIINQEDLSKRKTERTTKLRKAKLKQSAKNIASTKNHNKLHQRVIGGVKSSIAYYSKVMLVGIVISFGVLFIFSVFK